MENFNLGVLLIGIFITSFILAASIGLYYVLTANESVNDSNGSSIGTKKKKK
jgi:hypothetical protein